jgi:hypothetical protein
MDLVSGTSHTSTLKVSSGTAQAVGTMDRFVDASLASAGVHISELCPLTDLAVRTRNSVYRILVIDPHTSRVVVQGGQFFPLRTEATLSGSTLGGSCLKMRWIGEGFCMEVRAEDMTIVTSPVRAIEVQERPTLRPA